jgi:multidrug efflux pump subunit AcrA (membrane-fusion protein)
LLIKKLAAPAVALCLLITFAGCLPSEDEPVAAPVRAGTAVTFNLGAVTRGTLVQTKRVTLDYRPLLVNNYSFDIEGVYFDAIHVAAGDSVTTGDILASLDRSEIDQRVANAEFELRSAEITADMYAGTTSAEAARKRRNLAREKLDTVRAEAERYELRAESDGIVTFVKSVSRQKTSRSHEILFTVANGEPQYRVGTSDSGLFTPGEVYTLTLDKTEYTAVAQTENGAVYFTPDVTLEAPPAKGSILLTLERSEDTLIVPGKSVKRGTDGGSVVYVLNAAGLREAVPVETGIIVGGSTEIKNGLNEGDEIIVG